jgi:hypothetical protein
MLMGYFRVTKADDLDRVLYRYAVRAAVLVLIAHPLICVALYGPSGTTASFLSFMSRTVYITDVLALIFLVVVPLVPRTSPRVQLAVGAALLVVGRLLLLVPAHAKAELVVREVLAGLDRPGPTVMIATYPLLPVMGMFLVGTWFGHRFAYAERRGKLDVFAYRVFVRCGWLIALSAALMSTWAMFEWHVGGLHSLVVKKLLYPSYCFTYYPAYLAGTLFLVALLMTRTSVGRIERFFLVFGRTSLFTYVLQYYALQTLPWLLRWQHRMRPWQALAYLVVALPVMNAAAALYDRTKTGSIRQQVAGPIPGSSEPR